MRIVCPSCQAEYEVPDALLHADHAPAAKSRSVRCARCATEWHPEVPAALDIPDEPVAPAVVSDHDDPPFATPSVADETRLPTTRGGGALLAGLAWAASLAVLVAGCAAAYVWRDAIMQAWAPSARLFQWLGLGGG